MNKEILLTKSNLRKNKASSIGLFILMILSTALIGASMLLLFDAYPSVRKAASKLDAGDGFMCFKGYESAEPSESVSLDNAFVNSIFGDDVEKYDMLECLSYGNVSVPFAGGAQSLTIFICNSSAFDKQLNRTEIVEEDSSISGAYIYIPYQFYTGGGFKVGDDFSFELLGDKHSFKIKGFTLNTYMGCNNQGSYEFIVDAATYDRLYEKNPTAKASVVTYFLAEGKAEAEFRIRITNRVAALNDRISIGGDGIDGSVFSRSFMSLIIAVSFIVITLILIIVMTLMLANSISNYLRENMKTIGALKAMGYTSGNIKASLFMMFGGLAIVGSILGIAIAYIIMPGLATIVTKQMGVPYGVSFNTLSTICPVVFEIAFVIIVAAIASAQLGKIEPIVALKDGTKAHNFRKNHVPLDRASWSLNVSLAWKTMFTNAKQNVITFIITALMIFVCIIGYMMFENFNRHPKVSLFTFETFGGVVDFDKETAAEGRSFLESRSDATNIRRVTTLPFIYEEKDSVLVFIFDDTAKMNNTEVCYKGRIPQYDNEMAVSGKFAKIYGYEIGDEITFTHGDRSYRYLITGLLQTSNNFGKEGLMSEKAAEHLYDLPLMIETYYYDCNDKDTASSINDACAERFGEHMVTQLNFYETMEGALSSFKGIATLMMIIVCGIAAIVIALILYLLMKSFLYNKRVEFGIYKALGYTTRNLMLQTALGFMPAIVLAVIVSSIASYFLANPYISKIMGIFGLMKCTFSIPVPGVIVIGIAIVVFAFAVALFQARKIRRIEAYRMLVGE